MKFPWYIWIPRILLILVLLFMALFSLDVFDGKSSVWNKLLGFLIHNIPSLVLLLVLIVTWNRPLYGGIFLVLIALVFGIWYAINFKDCQLFDLLVFALPMLIAGLLFLLAYFKRTPA